MNLKTDDAIAKAMRKTYGDLSTERKEQLIATVRAAQPDKHIELHVNFTQGLSAPEKAFYLEIVDLTDEETSAANAAVNGKPAADPNAVTGAPSTPPPAKGATNGSAQ